MGVKSKHTKKKNMVLLIDGENISHTKVKEIKDKAEQQGELFCARVYGLQKDQGMVNWWTDARENDIGDRRLYGESEKNKIDKKIMKDADKIMQENKNVDIFCIASSDKDYIPMIKKLRDNGKRVVVLGEEKASDNLRDACNEFISI